MQCCITICRQLGSGAAAAECPAMTLMLDTSDAVAYVGVAHSFVGMVDVFSS